MVRRIPPGRVTTYGAIARYLGAPQSARLVGYALKASFAARPPVPAHRVVNREGRLTGKANFPGPARMEDLLRAEGVPIHED
uniref:DNA methyltransferase n=1 Tax=uncultured Bacteroidota bacterium TaxID=152509 RepID=H5SNW0_9BACT|nr:DNA methyltransferase [uncultured Bacteroidetes bacterium]